MSKNPGRVSYVTPCPDLSCIINVICFLLPVLDILGHLLSLDLPRLRQHIFLCAIVIVPDAGSCKLGKPICPKQRHQNGPHIREIFFAATAYKGHFSPLETQDNPFAAKFFWIVCRTVSTVYPYCWICSLPTDWEPSSLYIPTLSGPFSPKG